MKTTHRLFCENANSMSHIDDNTIDLVVTSPPYPMIKMWDEVFTLQNPAIGRAMNDGKGKEAFELMHKVLDPIWEEVYRVLKSGGFACINIGDATRTVNERFQLYSNHTRILQALHEIGFDTLPNILWRKQTNSPNKFMGSGMMPAGAYVTLEHEYVLIVRKNSKREFRNPKDKNRRRESAFFWEERNMFFSDIWFDIKGSRQAIDNKRLRSGAFPFELAYRLINMYSLKEDIVLDPFMGTGTTIAAAIASARNSIGYEIDNSFITDFLNQRDGILELTNNYIENRINNHINFVKERIKTKGNLKYKNQHYGFPVMTRQEKELLFNELLNIEYNEKQNVIEALYSDSPQSRFCGNWGLDCENEAQSQNTNKKEQISNSAKQMNLFDFKN